MRASPPQISAVFRPDTSEAAVQTLALQSQITPPVTTSQVLGALFSVAVSGAVSARAAVEKVAAARKAAIFSMVISPIVQHPAASGRRIADVDIVHMAPI